MNCKHALIAAVAASLLLPPVAFAAPAASGVAKPAKTKVTVKKKWRGYGFLPGYRTPEKIAAEQRRREQRYLYFSHYGAYPQLQYGWGRPGFYRGQWNGGSFGPCWTSTPIGLQWNCGR